MNYYWELEGQKFSLQDEVNGLKGTKAWLLKVIPENDSILDIGCGFGLVYELFRQAKRHNPYLGCDISKNYLKLAQTFFPGIPVEHQDAHFLPWGDNSSDQVILWSVLESLPDFRKALDEAFRVARKQIIITLFIPLVSYKDYNAWAVSDPPEYVVRINKKKFLNYLKTFNKPITFGTLKVKGKTKYWYFIIHKDE